MRGVRSNRSYGQANTVDERQLDKIGKAEEVQIGLVGRDETLRKPVTVWAVRQGDDVCLRSVRGRSGHWYRGAQDRHEGRLNASRSLIRPVAMGPN